MPLRKLSAPHPAPLLALLAALLATQLVACQRLDPNSPVAAFAKGKQAFDPDAAIRDAALLQKLSRLPWPLFPEARQPDTASNAQSAVWEHPEQFQLRVEEFQRSADALAAASQARSLDQLRPAVQALEQSCQRCHDQFRKM
jgi:cytochrome c556